MPKIFADAEAIVDEIIRDCGRRLVVGLPLGLGKANHVINALFARAEADRSINLTIFSALTLEKPKPSADIERRFIGPVIDRLFWGYPDLTYAERLRAGTEMLGHALRQADLVPGDILVGQGRPVQAAKAPAGHFLDRAT